MRNVLYTAIIVMLLGLFNDTVSAQQTRRRQEIVQDAEVQRLEQQLKFYREELEKVKVRRWQDKRNAIARKEAFAEAWEDIRRDIDQLNQRKSQREGMLMRLDNQISNMETELRAREDRQREFGIRISEKAGELIKFLQGGFPHNNQVQIENLQRLQSEIEGRGFRPSGDAIDALFAQQIIRFQMGESREIRREKFALENVTPTAAAPGTAVENLPENPGMVAGFVIRLGAIYSAFISTESPDAAILARSGNLGDRPWVWLEKIPLDKKQALQEVKNRIIVPGDSAIPLMIPLDVILRKATGRGFAAEEESTFWKVLKAEWVGAGFVIWIILGIVIISFVIVGQKVFLFATRGRGGSRLARRVERLVQVGKMDEALRLCQKRNSSVSSVLAAILSHREYGRKDAEDAAYAVMLGEIPRYEKQVNTINILAGAAPLVGLLGTVSGMVNLFAAINMHGTNDPKIMAAGIAEALLSTKWGLLVAIPLMLVYNLVTNMGASVVSDMEKFSATMINNLFGMTKQPPPTMEKIEQKSTTGDSVHV